MMKEMKKYEKPELEIIRFQTTDVVRTSGEGDDAFDNTGEEPDW